VDKDDPLAMAQMGAVYIVTGRHDEGVALSARAMERAPSYADVVIFHANNLLFAGQFSAGLAVAEAAMRLCPIPPPWYQSIYCGCLYFTGQFEAAAEAAQQALKRDPNYSTLYLLLAFALCRLGRAEEARGAAQGYYRTNLHVPGLQENARRYPFKDPTLIEPVIADLQRAGIR
jgi:Flp pilus assembly protein TadD